MCGGCVGVPSHICMLANQEDHKRAKYHGDNKPPPFVVVVEQMANQSDKVEGVPYEELTEPNYHNHTFGVPPPLSILELLD